MTTLKTPQRRSLHILLTVLVMLAALAMPALADDTPLGGGIVMDDGGIISNTATDAFEDDNTPEQASALPLDSTVQERNFGEAGDVDWVVVSLDAGRTYLFAAAPLADSPAQVRLALFGAHDTEAALIHGRPALDGGTLILWTAPASGDYYLRLSEAGGLGDATYTYQLKGERFVGLGLALRLQP